MTAAPGADALARRVADAHDLERRRWFGGWSLRRDGRQVAMVMDTVYVKVDAIVRDLLDATTDSHPFRYSRGEGRVVEVQAYRSVPEEMLQDAAALDALLAGRFPG